VRVVQVSCYTDPKRRDADALLTAWWTLGYVARAAALAGAEVTVVQAAAQDEVLERDGVRYQFVRERHPTVLRRRLGNWARPLTRRVAETARSLAPDVVHMQGLSLPLHTRLLCDTLPNVPVLVQDRADRAPRGWRSRVWRHGLARVAAVAFTTREQADPFVAAGVLSPDTPVFEVLGTSSWFNPGDIAAARQRSGLYGDPCFIWLGHLDANKDPLTIIDAVARAAPSLPNPHLWCCWGSAPLLDQVKQRIAGHAALRDRVHLLGPRPHAEIETLLQASDFLLQASRREGGGFVAIEALSCGVIPIVTDIPAFRRVTDNGVFGGLAQPGDVDAFVREIVAWAGRDREPLRVRAREHFERNLSFDALGRQLRFAYESVTQRTQAGTQAQAHA
jgi:glycosyltransferase involved in cell wall biosynthesis